MKGASPFRVLLERMASQKLSREPAAHSIVCEISREEKDSLRS